MMNIFVVLFVCYGSYTYNRKSVVLATPKLITEGLDTSDAGLIISCQNTALALSKFVVGLLSDRMNPQLIFVSGLFINGLTTILFSSSTSVAAFCGFWFLNGLAQGCAWPACAKIIRQKASPSQFGTLWSIMSSSYNISGSLSPFLSAYLILHHGWRTSVLIAGATSCLLGIVCLIVLRQPPSNPKLNTTKKRIPEEESSMQRNDSDFPAATIVDLLKDPFLWALSLSYLVVFCAKTTLVDWGQLFLMEERGRTSHDGSVFASGVEIGGFLGRIFVGYLTDYLIKRKLSASYTSKQRSNATVRLSVGMIFTLGSLLLIHALLTTVTENSSMLWLSFLGFMLGACFYGPIAVFGIVSIETAPSHLSGTSNAIAALAANVGAMISGFPLCYIAKHYKWSTVFLLLEVATGFALFGMLCARHLQPKLARHKKED